MAGDPARDFVSFAHSKARISKDGWHPLEAHLKSAAELAGLRHDLGKYQSALQRRIGKDQDAGSEDAFVSTRVDHSTPGAIHARKTFGELGTPLSFVIAAHHMGLEPPETEATSRAYSMISGSFPESFRTTLAPEILTATSKAPAEEPDRSAAGTRCAILETRAFLAPEHAARCPGRTHAKSRSLGRCGLPTKTAEEPVKS